MSDRNFDISFYDHNSPGFKKRIKIVVYGAPDQGRVQVNPLRKGGDEFTKDMASKIYFDSRNFFLSLRNTKTYLR